VSTIALTTALQQSVKHQVKRNSDCTHDYHVYGAHTYWGSSYTPQTPYIHRTCFYNTSVIRLL